MMELRLQKFMAECGVASRRHSETLIAEGKVAVNGEVVRQQGVRIDPEKDEVRVNGKLLKQPETSLYYLFNKPAGYLTTVSDPQGRPTIYDLMPDLKGKVIPVGRLDLDTEGLLILSNDGAFAFRMTHPKFGVRKTYRIKVQGVMTQKDIQRLQTGVDLEDGKTAPAKAAILKTGPRTTLLSLTIREGKKRQVRRMCDALGFPVLWLKRVAIENIKLSHVDSGAVRPLTEKELMPLMHRLQLPYTPQA